MELDDIFDMLSLIFVLGICILIGWGTINRVTNHEFLGLYEVIEDKTAPSQGYVNVNSDVGMSKLEAVLMTQVQEFGIPEPRRYKLGNTMIEIESSYKESDNLTYVGVTAYQRLKGAKFEVVYNWNDTPTDTSDDYYEVKEIVD